MIKSIFVLILFLAPVGCANLSNQPPATPTPAQIGAFSAAVIATNLNAADYLNYGITNLERDCAVWFGDQISGARTSSTLQQLLALGGTAAGVAGGPIGAGVAAATSLGSAALGAAQSNAPGGAMPAAIYTLVRKQLQAYVAAMPAPTSIADAAALIESAAEYCQGPSIAGAIMAALTTVPVATVWAPANFATTTSAGRVVPPVVVIGTPSASSPPETAAAPAAAQPRVSRPRARRPVASIEEPLVPISMLRLIDDRRIDPGAQRLLDDQWRTAIGAWLARTRPQVEEPTPPAPTPRPPPEEIEIEIIAPAEPPEAIPARVADPPAQVVLPPPRRRLGQ